MTTIAHPLHQMVESPAAEPAALPAESATRELLARANRGDAVAQRALYERFKPKVDGMAVRATAISADAEDLAQSIFLAIFRGLTSFEGRSDLSTWIHIVALNEIRKHWRTRKRKLDLLDSMEDPGQVADPRHSDPGEQIQLRVALRTLSQEHREVLELVVFQGLSYAARGESALLHGGRRARARFSSPDRAARCARCVLARAGNARGSAMKRCEEVLEILSAELDAQARAHELESAYDHLAGCASCRHEHDALRALDAQLRNAPAPALPDSFAQLEAALPTASMADRRARFALSLAAAAFLMLAIGSQLRPPRSAAYDRRPGRPREREGTRRRFVHRPAPTVSARAISPGVAKTFVRPQSISADP